MSSNTSGEHLISSTWLLHSYFEFYGSRNFTPDYYFFFYSQIFRLDFFLLFKWKLFHSFSHFVLIWVTLALPYQRTAACDSSALLHWRVPSGGAERTDMGQSTARDPGTNSSTAAITTKTLFCLVRRLGWGGGERRDETAAVDEWKKRWRKGYISRSSYRPLLKGKSGL